MGVVDAQPGDTISLPIAVRDVKVYLFRGAALPEELENTGYRCCPIDIVISIDEDLFLAPAGEEYPVDGFVHVLHQPGIMQVGEAGTKEAARLVVSPYATVYQYPAEEFVDPQGCLQRADLIGVRLQYVPVFVHVLIGSP